MIGAGSYVGFGAVVTADVWVLLTEAFVELQLAKIRQQLNSSALHRVLTEMHHAVKVVEMSGLSLSVTLSVHCEKREKQKHFLGVRHLNKGRKKKSKSLKLLHTADNPLDALDIGVRVEEDTMREFSISASSS